MGIFESWRLIPRPGTKVSPTGSFEFVYNYMTLYYFEIIARLSYLRDAKEPVYARSRVAAS